MVTQSKPDFTFGELDGVDDLAAMGIEIEDGPPQEQRRTKPPPNKVRRLRETLDRWTREQEEKLVQVNPEAVARDRETAEALGVTALLPEYAEILARNETIPGRIRDRLADLAKDLPQAKLGTYGSRGVWWAEVDPLTHRWVVPADQSAVASGDLVVGMFNGQTRAAVIDKPEDIADGVLLDAGSDQVLGNRVGRVLQRFSDSYHDIKRRHESGELRQEWEAQEAVSGRGLPEPSASPPAADGMPEPSAEEATSAGSVEVAQATVRDPDTGETVILTAAKEGDGPTVVTAQSEGGAGPLMAATEAAMVDVAERSAVPSENTGAEGSGFEPLPDDFDLSAYGFGDKDDSPSFEEDAATGDDPPTADVGVAPVSQETVNVADAEPVESQSRFSVDVNPFHGTWDVRIDDLRHMPYSFHSEEDANSAVESAADAPNPYAVLELQARESRQRPLESPSDFEPAPTAKVEVIQSRGVQQQELESRRASLFRRFGLADTANSTDEGLAAAMAAVQAAEADGTEDQQTRIWNSEMRWAIEREQKKRGTGEDAVVEPAPAESPATDGQGFEPLPDDYDLSAYGFGDKPDDGPEPAPEPDKYKLANQHGEMLADRSSHERDSDEWRRIAHEGYDAYLDDLDGIKRPKMVWRTARIVPTRSGYVAEPIDSPESKPEPMDGHAEVAGVDEETAALAKRLRGNILAGSDLSDAELVARHRASQLELEEDERRRQETAERRQKVFEQATAYIREREPELLGNRGKARIWAGVQHSGKVAVPDGTDVQPGDFVVARDMQAGDFRNQVYKLTAPKGLGYTLYDNITSQKTGEVLLEKHGSAYSEWHSPSEAAAAPSPDIEPESVDDSASEPDDTSPASESRAEASEPEPEPPPPAPVLADAEPGPAEPPDVITPTTGKGPPEPPKVASVSRNDTAEQLQQKWKQADQSIDAYAKAYGITGIPDDAARLELRPDGTIGVERLKVTPQGSAYRTPAPKASGTGNGGGGGGSTSAKPSPPAIGLRKSWEKMSHAEKQAVIDVINDALARRALLSSALVTMTCSPTGDIPLSKGQKMATIVGSCAPRSSPVSPRQSLQAHPWLSNREVATLGGGKRKGSQSKKGKKSTTRR